MTADIDKAARLRALQDLDATLLVEAAAGTGKTALIAGRVTMLLASGCQPLNIAAITFTEAAASELSARVHRYVDELLEGRVPPSLSEALSNGLQSLQRSNLARARAKLDELTATTIHGFCQAILHSYAVESDIDPGARIIDASQAIIAFDAVFDRWMRRRLTISVADGDPVAFLSKKDPKHVVSTLKVLARLRRDHRTARPAPADLTGRPDLELAEAVHNFRAWFAGVRAEPETASVIGDLELLSEFYKNSFAQLPDFPLLWKLAHPPPVRCMRKASLELRRPQWQTAWQRAAGRADGTAFSAAALAHFDEINNCYSRLLGKVATALSATLSTELDEVLKEYEAFKRAAAVLDFDDLLYRTRDLIRKHSEVRSALGQRYQRLLVDEFQDTDPIQAEILFRIAASDMPPEWSDATIRRGALFMVGDPKQAIYRFRGAHFETYERARSALKRGAPEDILHITTSFRSLPSILAHVNRCFVGPLSTAGQPGYVPLTSTRTNDDATLPCVAKKTIEELQPDSTASQIRNAEARQIADLCAHLILNVRVPAEAGGTRPLEPSDIALLAPTGTELWRYEQSLEDHGLPYASQAGKNLFGRQEVQDLLCISRVLADPRDTMAFGALMRGPLVGLTEDELLEITASLPPVSERPELIPRFSVLTDPSAILHPVAREVLSVTRDLRRRVDTTSPMLLLSEAIERLHLRPILALREGQRSGRAMANVDVFLELARGYPVRGFKRFVRDVTRDWEARESREEGRVDAQGQAIEIVTIHRSKGLEWPVVILINTATRFRSRDEFVYRASDETLHWILGDVVPPELRAALDLDDQGAARERERLLYVAFTRAQQLLILPKLPNSPKTWTTIINDPHQDLLELDLSAFVVHPLPTRGDGSNEQTFDLFQAQRSAIASRIRRVKWLRPSQDDLDRIPVHERLVGDADDQVELPSAVGAGRVRGLVLHKLMEEVLNGETTAENGSLAIRADELMSQLVTRSGAGQALPKPEEMASTVIRTLALPDIARLRSGLVPEVAVLGTLAEQERVLVAGRADALFMEGKNASIVIDWKSDVDPSTDDVERHAAQLGAYMRATGVARGALVYMSTSKVKWVETVGAASR